MITLVVVIPCIFCMFLPKLRVPNTSVHVFEKDKIPYITKNRLPRSTQNCKTSDLQEKQNRITSTIGLEEKETKNLEERNNENVQMMQMQKQKLTGVEALLKEGGLKVLIEAMRKCAFPKARTEAKELYRVGHKTKGLLSRQSAEPSRK